MRHDEFDNKKMQLEDITNQLSESAQNPETTSLQRVIALRDQAEKLYAELKAEIDKCINSVESELAA